MGKNGEDKLCCISSIICPILTVMLAIIGGCLVGLSGCDLDHNSFCTNNPTFVAGFCMLILMALTLFTWMIIGIITGCCYDDFGYFGAWGSLVCVYLIVISAIIGGTLVGVSGCNLDIHSFCTGNSMFVAGFSFLMIMAMSAFCWIILGFAVCCQVW